MLPHHTIQHDAYSLIANDPHIKVIVVRAHLFHLATAGFTTGDAMTWNSTGLHPISLTPIQVRDLFRQAGRLRHDSFAEGRNKWAMPSAPKNIAHIDGASPDEYTRTYVDFLRHTFHITQLCQERLSKQTSHTSHHDSNEKVGLLDDLQDEEVALLEFDQWDIPARLWNENCNYGSIAKDPHQQSSSRSFQDLFSKPDIDHCDMDIFHIFLLRSQQQQHQEGQPQPEDNPRLDCYTRLHAPLSASASFTTLMQQYTEPQSRASLNTNDILEATRICKSKQAPTHAMVANYIVIGDIASKLQRKDIICSTFPSAAARVVVVLTGEIPCAAISLQIGRYDGVETYPTCQDVVTLRIDTQIVRIKFYQLFLCLRSPGYLNAVLGVCVQLMILLKILIYKYSTRVLKWKHEVYTSLHKKVKEDSGRRIESTTDIIPAILLGVYTPGSLPQ